MRGRGGSEALPYSTSTDPKQGQRCRALLQTIHHQIATFSKDRIVVNAMRDFRRSFRAYRDEPEIEELDLPAMRAAAELYYPDEFGAQYKNQNGGADPEVPRLISGLDGET